MPHYVVAALTVKDPSFVAEYGPGAAKCVAKHGGRYLARGPALSLEGAAPQVLVILEFPDETAVKSFHTDPEYKPYLDLRRRATDSDLWAVAGI